MNSRDELIVKEINFMGDTRQRKTVMARYMLA